MYISILPCTWFVKEINMNKEFVLYSIIMSTSLSIKAIKAEHNACEYSASTRLSENHLEHKTHYPHGHDELDTMCEQL